MGVGLLGIDHPVIAVGDMTEARVRYQRLGFTIPPRGRHLEWGTGNWCLNVFRAAGADFQLATIGELNPAPT